MEFIFTIISFIATIIITTDNFIRRFFIKLSELSKLKRNLKNLYKSNFITDDFSEKDIGNLSFIDIEFIKLFFKSDDFTKEENSFIKDEILLNNKVFLKKLYCLNKLKYIEILTSNNRLYVEKIKYPNLFENLNINDKYKDILNTTYLSNDAYLLERILFNYTVNNYKYNYLYFEFYLLKQLNMFKKRNSYLIYKIIANNLGGDIEYKTLKKFIEKNTTKSLEIFIIKLNKFIFEINIGNLTDFTKINRTLAQQIYKIQDDSIEYNQYIDNYIKDKIFKLSIILYNKNYKSIDNDLILFYLTKTSKISFTDLLFGNNIVEFNSVKSILNPRNIIQYINTSKLILEKDYITLNKLKYLKIKSKYKTYYIDDLFKIEYSSAINSDYNFLLYDFFKNLEFIDIENISKPNTVKLFEVSNDLKKSHLISMSDNVIIFIDKNKSFISSKLVDETVLISNKCSGFYYLKIGVELRYLFNAIMNSNNFYKQIDDFKINYDSGKEDSINIFKGYFSKIEFFESLNNKYRYKKNNLEKLLNSKGLENLMINLPSDEKDIVKLNNIFKDIYNLKKFYNYKIDILNMMNNQYLKEGISNEGEIINVENKLYSLIDFEKLLLNNLI